MPSELLEGTSELITLFLLWQGKKSCTPSTRVTQQVVQALTELSTSQISVELILFSIMVIMWRAKRSIKIITKCK